MVAGNENPKNCFVISPIGGPGSTVREHADDVFDFIIKPACKRAGVIPVRADHDTRPGIITEQMYDAILKDADLLIAVLTFHNPNVFYEIAIAEAAARPLILMIAHDDSIPFDIKDRRVISYDLKPRSLQTGTYEKALLKAILDAMAPAPKGRRKVPFRPSLNPLSEKTVSILDRTASLDTDERIALVLSAQNIWWSRGLATFNLPKGDEINAALTAARERGVEIRVLLMDPENPALQHQLKDPGDAGMIREYIGSGIKEWTRALSGAGELRLQTRGYMSGMAQLNESRGIITQYALDSSTSDSPVAMVTSDDPLYRAARAEYEYVWKHASAPIEKPVARKGPAKKPAGKTAAKKKKR
jgi:hypothetical protein